LKPGRLAHFPPPPHGQERVLLGEDLEVEPGELLGGLRKYRCHEFGGRSVIGPAPGLRGGALVVLAVVLDAGAISSRHVLHGQPRGRRGRDVTGRGGFNGAFGGTGCGRHRGSSSLTRAVSRRHWSQAAASARRCACLARHRARTRSRSAGRTYAFLSLPPT